MMYKYLTASFLCLTVALNALPAYALRCEIFDLINFLVTPLPINDSNGGNAMSITNLQQGLQTVQAGIEDLTALQKNLKISLDPDMAKGISAIDVPQMEDFTKGTETTVEAFKGQVVGLEEKMNVDFTKPETTQKAIEATAVVANPVGMVEEAEAKERKIAFLQQSRMDLLARILFYKSELETLKQSDMSAQGTSSSEDTAGTLDVSIQMKDMQTRVQALQQKLTAAQIELESIRNLQMADTIQEPVNVQGEKS